MLLEFGQSWCCDHCPGLPVPGNNQSLSEKLLSDVQPGFLLTTASFHFLVSSCWPPKRGYQHLPLCCPAVVDCPEVTPQPFSSPNWTKPSNWIHASQVLPSRPFPVLVTLLWTNSNSLIFFLYWCIQNHTWGGAMPVQCWVGSDLPQSASYAVLDAPQVRAGPFGCQCTLLTHIQLAIKWVEWLYWRNLQNAYK